MKSYKANLLFIFAILAFGIIFATKAGKIGSKLVMGCFSVMTVTNGLGSSVPLQGLGCTAARAQVTLNPFVVSASIIINPSEDCLLPEEIFCCATVVETSNTRAPLINLGDGLKRYAVDKVYCKIFLSPRKG